MPLRTNMLVALLLPGILIQGTGKSNAPEGMDLVCPRCIQYGLLYAYAGYTHLQPTKRSPEGITNDYGLEREGREGGKTKQLWEGCTPPHGAGLATLVGDRSLRL